MRYIYKTKLRIMEKSLIVHLHVKNIGMENYLDIFLNIFYVLKLLIQHSTVEYPFLLFPRIK